MLFVANWKLNKSFAQSLAFCKTYKADLKKLSFQAGIELVVCPSFPALFSMSELLKDTKIRLGGQTCSAYNSGAYTGQVSAQSLKETGCDYCIIGHSEQRQYADITNKNVAQAAKNLCALKIEPIICIGETKEQFQQRQTMKALENQLHLVLDAVKDTQQQITIAYEPVWAIGTNTVPKANYLKTIVEHVSTVLSKKHSGPWRIIYGGSVSEKTINNFREIPSLSGYLIGSGSLDFQKFEKIVSLGK